MVFKSRRVTYVSVQFETAEKICQARENSKMCIEFSSSSSGFQSRKQKRPKTACRHENKLKHHPLDLEGILQ